MSTIFQMKIFQNEEMFPYLTRLGHLKLVNTEFVLFSFWNLPSSSDPENLGKTYWVSPIKCVSGSKKYHFSVKILR